MPCAKRPTSSSSTPSSTWRTPAATRSSSSTTTGHAAFLDLEGFSLVECAGTAGAGHWLAAWIDSPESVVDTGVARAISTPNAVPSHPARGALFETAVFAETRKAVSLMSPRPIVHHRQTSAGARVDLLERDGTFFPIEVKAARRPSRGDTTGITAFRKTYAKLRVARGLVGAPFEAMTPLSENDWAMPWDAVVPSPAPFRHSSAQRFAPAAKRPSPRSGPGPEKG